MENTCKCRQQEEKLLGNNGDTFMASWFDRHQILERQTPFTTSTVYQTTFQELPSFSVGRKKLRKKSKEVYTDNPREAEKNENN